ncbi:MAG: hypothetical protein IJG84_03360 [Kiritimatiellae bacterium]|nr:hypothetical protein [Kiritimatiellia bacterium]
MRSLLRLLPLFASFAASAAGSVSELYPGHMTFLLDFDDGTPTPRLSGLKPQNPAAAVVAEGGLFGTKGFVAGGCRYLLPKGQRVFDTRRPGTLVFWLKTVHDFAEPPVVEPGATFFSAEWTPQRRFLVFRQGGLRWGEAGVDAFYETHSQDGRRVTARAPGGGSLKGWKAGEWHMVVSQWSPDGFAQSLDGAPLRRTVISQAVGPFAGAIGFGLYPEKGSDRSLYVMDDIAILDFAMSDEQIAELYRAYRAQMREAPRTATTPKAAVLKAGRAPSGGFEVVVGVESMSAEAQNLVLDFGARPANSQPTKRREAFRLAPRGSKKFTVRGPAAADEKVDAVVRLSAADGTVLFSRRRVFTPDGSEPEWMRAPSALSFKFAYYPYDNTVHALADVSACDGFSAAKEVRLSIRRKDSSSPVSERGFPAERKTGRTEVFWRGIPELDGEYVCTVSFPGLKDVTASQAFVRRRFQWEHNKLGRSGAVPAPFTPVVRGKDRVSVVLRDHEIGTLGLWRQVKAVGKDLLSRPIALEGPGAADAMRRASATSDWDVDGMMTWTLALKPGRYEPFSLVIPMREDRATLYHACVDGLRSNDAGAIPAGEGRVWDSSMAKGRRSIVGSYLPYVWIGGPLRGIATFGENDRGWVVDGKTPCLEIVRRPGEVALVANLVQAPTEFSEQRVIRLALQATPVKPMPDGWRALSHGTLLGACYYWGGFWDSHSVEPFDGTDEFFRVMGESRRTGVYNKEYLARAVDSYPYPYATNTAKYAEHHARILAHYRNGLWTSSRTKPGEPGLVFYTNGRGVHYGDPKGQGATFCNEWNRFEYMDRNFTVLSMKAYDLDPVESFRDYAAWWYERMLSTGAADHIYWDDVFCSSSFNLVQTDAYRLPTGQIQPSSGIFNMRAQVRRCAVLQAELGKDTRGNWVHMTNTAMAPVLAFAGVNYDWEDSSGRNPPQVKYPRDYILACTIGRQFGNRVGIMGYFDFSLDKKGDEYLRLERCRAGVLLAHELRGTGASYEKAHAMLCDWGYRTPGVDVWNYWDEDVPFPVAVSGLEVATLAMAKKSSREAMVVVSSFSGRDGSAAIRPDAEALGLPSGWRAFDAETGAPLPAADGAVDVALDAYGFRIVRLAAK